MQNDLNKLNQYLCKNYYVNAQNDIVIRGVMDRVVFSELEQEQLIKELDILHIRKELGEAPSLMHQLCLTFLFKGTY